jgi:hypothetical protein
MSAPREGQTSTSLPDGQVVGVCGGGPGPEDPSAEVYDPKINQWLPAAGGMGPSPEGHTATLLKDGTVLVAGGEMASTPVAGAEVLKVRTLRLQPAKSSRVQTYFSPILIPAAIAVLVLGGLVATIVFGLRRRKKGI